MRNKISRRKVAGGLAMVGAGLVIDGALPRRVRAAAARDVTFIFDVSPYGKHALFYPAIDNGYFRDMGLNVSLQAGKGSADVAVKVAAGCGRFRLCRRGDRYACARQRSKD